MQFRYQGKGWIFEIAVMVLPGRSVFLIGVLGFSPGSASANGHAGRQQVMTQIRASLPSVWNMGIEFLAPSS